MGYIKNSDGESLDLILISAEPKYVKIESTSNLLNGNWHVQTVGNRAEKISVNVIVAYSVMQYLFDYADTKEILTIDFHDFTENGFIISQPEYELFAPAEDTIYNATFELAVIPNV